MQRMLELACPNAGNCLMETVTANIPQGLTPRQVHGVISGAKVPCATDDELASVDFQPGHSHPFGKVERSATWRQPQGLSSIEATFHSQLQAQLGSAPLLLLGATRHFCPVSSFVIADNLPGWADGELVPLSHLTAAIPVSADDAGKTVRQTLRASASSEAPLWEAVDAVRDDITAMLELGVLSPFIFPGGNDPPATAMWHAANLPTNVAGDFPALLLPAALPFDDYEGLGAVRPPAATRWGLSVEPRTSLGEHAWRLAKSLVPAFVRVADGSSAPRAVPLPFFAPSGQPLPAALSRHQYIDSRSVSLSAYCAHVAGAVAAAAVGAGTSDHPLPSFAGRPAKTFGPVVGRAWQSCSEGGSDKWAFKGSMFNTLVSAVVRHKRAALQRQRQDRSSHRLVGTSPTQSRPVVRICETGLNFGASGASMMAAARAMGAEPRLLSLDFGEHWYAPLAEAALKRQFGADNVQVVYGDSLRTLRLLAEAAHAVWAGRPLADAVDLAVANSTGELPAAFASNLGLGLSMEQTTEGATSRLRLRGLAAHLRRVVERFLPCDVVFVDGGHTEDVALGDLAQFSAVSHRNTPVTIDDGSLGEVQRAAAALERLGLFRQTLPATSQPGDLAANLPQELAADPVTGEYNATALLAHIRSNFNLQGFYTMPTADSMEIPPGPLMTGNLRLARERFEQA